MARSRQFLRPMGVYASQRTWTLAVIALLLGCNRPPSERDLRDWSPTDHDRAEEKNRPGPGRQAAPARRTETTPNDPRQLAELAWRSQCALCHGADGRGDGPQGPMVMATNLTEKGWQVSRTDVEIARAIQQGKGRMPKFDLPEAIIAALVQHVRGFQQR